jgi:AraC-like DNA-binding protein
LKRETAPDPRIGFAARMLQRGGTGVGRLAEETNLSPKHFVHEFERQVGVTPKYFGRIQRLQRTIVLVGHRSRVDWPEVALDGGFYDQAHLINEFRRLIGLTPTEYLARRSLYPGYLNVA